MLKKYNDILNETIEHIMLAMKIKTYYFYVNLPADPFRAIFIWKVMIDDSLKFFLPGAEIFNSNF